MKVVEVGGFYELSPSPESVAAFTADSAITLRLVGPHKEDLLVRIEAPFRLLDVGAARVVRPDDVTTMAPILDLVRRHVDRLRVARDGQLFISFSGGMAIEVDSEGPFEAWHLTVTGGPMLIGGPDRTISVFDGGTYKTAHENT